MSLEVVPITPNIIDGQLVYAVKFLCGTIGPDTKEPPLLPGRYMTAINIHNPWAHPVDFEKRAIVTLRQDVKNQPPLRGPLGHPRPDHLEPDNGLEVDCEDIQQVLLPGAGDLGPFVKGFVVIRVRDPKDILDVVAVYTSTV